MGVEQKNCKIEGCKGEYRAKGYCTRHYRKWRQGEYKKTRYKICTEENCKKPRFKGSLCEAHDKARRDAKGAKTGVVAPPPAATPPAA